MNRATKVGLGVLAGTLLVVAVANASPGFTVDDDDESDGAMGQRKTRLWNKLQFVAELTPTQRYFLMLWAYGEGKYSATAHNDSASERAWSAEGADNNPTIVQRVIACGIDPAKLRTGSWGTFQRLAPFAAGDAFEVFGNAGCKFADPTRMPIDLNWQIASAIETARDLQGYDGFKFYPTVGNLRLGTGAVTRLGYISANAERIERYRRQAASQGLPPNIVDAQITRFPTNVADIYERLRSQGPP